MYDRNGKSECILTNLCVFDYEYIWDRIAKYHKKNYSLHELSIFKY